MVVLDGVEPSISALSAQCFTVKLQNYIIKMLNWKRWRDSNPQPSGYEPDNLPLIYIAIVWWIVSGSNRRPPACKAGALPAELTTRVCVW